jgi:hypothetical protein
LGAGNVLVWLIVTILTIIIGYVLSIFRIENIPIDRFFFNKILYLRKKDKIEIFDKSIDFSKWKRFEDVVKNKIWKLISQEKEKK